MAAGVVALSQPPANVVEVIPHSLHGKIVATKRSGKELRSWSKVQFDQDECYDQILERKEMFDSSLDGVMRRFHGDFYPSSDEKHPDHCHSEEETDIYRFDPHGFPDTPLPIRSRR